MMVALGERKMKKSILALSLLGLYGSSFAADFTDTARVISSTPIYERVNEPRQECWTETVTVNDAGRPMSATILGGITGGLLGSQVGNGNGSNVATGAGAIAGAIVGDKVGNPNSNRPVTGSIVGGIAGALLGSQIGGGSGKKAATTLGAIAGAVVGDRVANPVDASGRRTEQVQRCKDVSNYRNRITGYTVVYRYSGKDMTTTLPYQPGSTIRVAVNVSIAEERPAERYNDYDYRNNDARHDKRHRDNRHYRDDDDNYDYRW
jgi:uncharacterized protein YcfJ